MNEHTQTQDQSTMLRALAEHLEQHAELWPVNILSNDRLQLRSPRSPAAELVRHADALTSTISVDVHRVYSDESQEYRAFVYVAGLLGDRFRLDVWDVVPGLLDAIGPESFETTGSAQITVEGLREFAEHSTSPALAQPEVAG